MTWFPPFADVGEKPLRHRSAPRASASCVFQHQRVPSCGGHFLAQTNSKLGPHAVKCSFFPPHGCVFCIYIASTRWQVSSYSDEDLVKDGGYQDLRADGTRPGNISSHPLSQFFPPAFSHASVPLKRMVQQQYSAVIDGIKSRSSRRIAPSHSDLSVLDDDSVVDFNLLPIMTTRRT